MRSLRCAGRRVVHSQTPSDAPSILSSAWNCARALAGPAWVFPRAAMVAVIARLARRATLVPDDDRCAVALQAVAGDAADPQARGVPARRASCTRRRALDELVRSLSRGASRRRGDAWLPLEYPVRVAVEALRAAYQSLSEGDVEPLVSLIHPEMEWRGRRRLSRFWRPPT